MRKFTLACALTFLSSTVQAFAQIPVQSLPQTGDMYEMLDLSDPYRTTISGLFAQEIAHNDQSNSIHVYIGAENRQSEPYVMLLVDADVDVPEFLETSGWTELAEEQGLIVVVAQPSGDSWDPAADLGWVAEVYDVTHNRSHYNAQKGNNYLLGYGDAATIAQRWALSDPGSFSSFASFGDITGIEPAYIDEAGSAELQMPGEQVSDLPMPVWMFVSEMDDNAALLLDEWKSRNQAMEEEYSTELATGAFLARQNGIDSLLNQQDYLAQTRYTVTENPAEPDVATTRAVWDFLNDTIRPVGFADNQLRASRSVEEWGATTQTIEIDGVTRYWVEFVPGVLLPVEGETAPMVVYLHGNNNTAEAMLQRSEFLKIANERGFIAILLTGALYNSDEIFPNPHWNLMEEPEKFDDYAYVRAATLDAAERLPVDRSRIYVMGQSYGSMSMLAMSLRMNDIFAAAAGTGAFLVGDQPELYNSDKVLKGNLMPINVLAGEHDSVAGGGTWENERMRAQFPIWFERNGLKLDVDEALTGTYKSGRYRVYEFANEDNVPIMQYLTVDDRIHTIVAGDLWFQYDTWVSRWSRGEDGTLYYMGNAVN